MTATQRLGADQLDEAADLLARGGVVAFPTETVYGLGANAADADAVAKIYEAKGRPIGHPLIVHVGTADAAWTWVREVSEAARVLAEAFWPGPLTLILPRNDKAADITVGGLDSVGLRVPGHPLARALIERLGDVMGDIGAGLAGPSANRFGHVSPTTAAHVLDDLDGRIEVVLDGGPSRVGVESTIVELVDERITVLRPGGVTVAQLRDALRSGGVTNDVLVESALDGSAGESRAAGMLASHYAPDSPVVVVGSLDDVELTSADAVVGPEPVEHRPSVALGTTPADFAVEMYAALRRLDEMAEVERIVVVRPPDGPMIAAVLDRLVKASAPRR